MDDFIKLNNQTAGRDKIARLIQFLCRALWDSYTQNEFNSAFIERLKTLEYLLGSFRKLLNFGKSFDFLYASLKTIHYPDATLRFTLTFAKLAQAVFQFCDHIVWLARSGLFKQIDLNKWNTAANKYWTFAIVMNLCRDAYEISKIFDSCVKSKGSCLSIRSVPQVTGKVCASLYQHQAVLVDTIKNGCDFFIPMTTLGYTKLSPRTIGVLGAVSSLAGIIEILYPVAKLVPA